MASLTYAAIDMCGFQANRLDCAGNVLNGPTDVVVSCGLVDMARKPVTGDDRTTSDNNGTGGYCVKRSIKGKIEEYEITLTLCSVTDGELLELLGIYDVIPDASGRTIGVKPRSDAADCACAPAAAGCTNPGVSLLTWSTAWCGEEQRTDLPFVINAYPKVVFDPGSLEVTRSSEFNVYTITGTTRKNTAWGQGPGAIYPEAAGLDRHWGEFLSDVSYPGGCNCGACDGDAGYATAGEGVGL